ncbi:NAD-dependent methanol dehydrogenase [Pelotomaculum sp. FP]|uniref:iron-containing alcohol dehydrogenase n=1 Tax=Pelotomaculum sp. FP TaxID=261474 RepID=UPI0010667895|nr:iron-containing alcohol dehydrogenase [Pelotomaculum sp. FP]TEB16406.1 NAD-dependent methanol dehydrogenase [Pelotomaculum sp. FP]
MMEIATYSQTCPTIFGTGAVKLIGEKAKELNITKAMIVTDEGLVKVGVAAKVEGLLKEAGIEVVIFDKVMPDPLDTVCNEGGEVARLEHVDGIVGLGGGSVMDAAKAINILTTNPAPISQWYERWDYKKGLPIILVPTTAGTGSENTIYGVITNSATGAKKVVLTTGTLAICDPELTYKLPPHLTASTGMDVFAHAAESMTTIVTNPMTTMLSFDAIRKVTKWLPVAYREPTNIEARENMMLASNFAGIAFSNTCCHLGHAISQCMGAAFHVPHGISCAWALPETMAFAAIGKFEEVKGVADALGVEYSDSDSPQVLGKKVADNMRAFMKSMDIKSIADYGITKEQLVGIADMIMADNCWPFIPSPLTKAELEEILVKVYDNYK